MTMTYTPSWEKKNNKWDTEPEVWDSIDYEELENAKVADEISLDDLIIEEMELEESEFDLDLEQTTNYFGANNFCSSRFNFSNCSG